MPETPVAPSPFPALGKRKSTMTIAYGFTIAFMLCTLIVVIFPSNHSSLWFRNVLHVRSNFSSILSSHFHPRENSHIFSSPPSNILESNPKSDIHFNDTDNTRFPISTKNENGSESLMKNNNRKEKSKTRDPKKAKRDEENWLKLMDHCDLFDGKWVKDDSYPLYEPGSCPHIDEPFNCFLNGRLDTEYQKYKWQPKNCNIPRFNGRAMLKLLRGKRLVFVGDSLNRNMWESLICILRNSVKDKSRVFEVSGRQEFRTEGSYAFVFKDYNCSVEFFQSPFLVQEWEMQDTNGSKKETLRLDIVERSSDRYKTADFLVFNTGHWWTHEKTSKGEEYYQEGSHVYGQLHVDEAFRKAMTTWARWVDANINTSKTMVLFRGYSASHFRGGRWNSGGECDNETEPIKKDSYLTEYPKTVKVLESVMKGMKTPVFYLNITRISDYRIDGHPSIYRKKYLTEEERRSPLRYQDCSHWCLPGVPDLWNEIMYTQILIKLKKDRKQYQQRDNRTNKTSEEDSIVGTIAFNKRLSGRNSLVA